jgi:hypothetical protein
VGEIEDQLWNPEVGPDDYGGEAAYRRAVLEQYKLYVEMADRVSQRRALANTFFLTLNTGIFTVIGILRNGRPASPVWALVFPLVAVVGQCVAWFFLVNSYRQLNAAKFKVVGALEQRLPASPWWRAEWDALGHGQDRRLYWPLTHIERWIPILFAVTYIAAYVAFVFAY